MVKEIKLNDNVSVNQQEIVAAIESLGIAGNPVCLHSSLRSFGRVEVGAEAVIEAFLDAGCTLMVPAFSSGTFEVIPDDDQHIERNGWDVIEAQALTRVTSQVYSPDTNVVDASMGAVPKAVLARNDRIRGNHPLNSFAAVGPLAEELIEGQTWSDVYAPFRELAKIGGSVVLAGVGLNRMTILHLAEALAGRRLFRRWATGPGGKATAVPIGGCSEGFPNLERVVGMLAFEATVGKSTWRAFPAAEVITTAAAVIRVEPGVTHCGDPECIRCPAAVAGGPLIR